MKERFSFRTVRKKIILISKLAGIILMISYLISTRLPLEEDISLLLWVIFLILLIMMIDYLLGRFISDPIGKICEMAHRAARLDFSLPCGITSKDEFGELADNLNKMSENLQDTLEKLEKGLLTPEPQTEENTCYAKMLTKALGKMDWEKTAVELERLIRGLNPWPSAYTGLDGKTLKIWQARVLEEEYEGKPGCVVRAKKDDLFVKTGKGTLAITSLQLEGKKRMDAGAFLRGYPVEEGTVLSFVSSEK